MFSNSGSTPVALFFVQLDIQRVAHFDFGRRRARSTSDSPSSLASIEVEFPSVPV